MAELATLARPYADALLKAAKPADLSSWLTQVQALAALAADPQIALLADHPRVTKAQVFDVISGAVKQPLNASIANFLQTVIDNGRLSAMPQIAEQFQYLVNAQQGVSKAVIYSAFPMNEQQLADLQPALEKRFGYKLQATVQVDPALIGGVRVVVGDEVLDTSVKARLERMKSALAA